MVLRKRYIYVFFTPKLKVKPTHIVISKLFRISKLLSLFIKLLILMSFDSDCVTLTLKFFNGIHIKFLNSHSLNLLKLVLVMTCDF